MVAISMKELLEAGAHFGHQTRRWDPRMDEYIFTSRNGIHIIDLQKTLRMADDAYNWVKGEAADGANFLFVGTKKQATEAIEEEAKRAGVAYVNHRWLGGTLTNWNTIKTRINKLKELRAAEEDGSFDKLPKKEASQLGKQKAKLEKFLGGIADMEDIPDVMFVVDPKTEEIAVKEARTLNIPVVAMIDTNGNPDLVDVKIPANDDAIRAVKLITSKMADAIIEGRQGQDAGEDSAEKTFADTADGEGDFEESSNNENQEA
ncbi:30S ribosomal protein S2 [Oenococcus oeni]|uniref:30S ribosomal protein S2 n=1 Tax=Oenococcus oeni TaxID=1247 RepID=UPI00050D9276|nr:30S ribosomal protein S2 [Oenococcus oeni]KGH71684.1 30S ribosomal protein S2 [Oenococcus oeni IOEB_0502]